MPVYDKPKSNDHNNAYLTDPYAGVHYDRVQKDMTRRLQPSCTALTRAEFSLLIEKMVREQIRGEHAKF
jgi:hypothetical protein